MLNILALANRAVEDNALRCIGCRTIERIMPDANRFRGNENPFGIEAMQDIRESTPLLADAIFARNEQVVDEDGV